MIEHGALNMESKHKHMTYAPINSLCLATEIHITEFDNMCLDEIV